MISAQRSILRGDELAAWLADTYGEPAPGTCSLLFLGLNDHYLWEPSVGRRSVVRVYRKGWRTADQAAEECAFLRHLKARGVPVAGPLPTRGGADVVVLDTPEGERPVVLFEYADGDPLCAADAELYGETMAAIHAAADSFAGGTSRPPTDLTALVSRPLDVIDRMYAARPDDLAYIRDVGRRVLAGFEALPVGDLAWGWCHNDLHGGNAHRAGGVITPFDFDLTGPGWRAFDLATYRWGASMGWPADQEQAWQDLLRGYQRSRPLPELELRAVDHLVLARHIWWIALQDDCTRWVGTAVVGDRFLASVADKLRAWDKALEDAPPTA